MKEEFQIHNLFRESLERFLNEDPHLRRAALQPFSYVSPLVDTPEFLVPGILMITGGRQVGKTTCLKQFIAKVLSDGRVLPDQLSFMTGELIRDDSELCREITSELEGRSGWHLIVVDEISYVKDWDKGVKFLADAGILEETTLILSGSDSSILREAMKRFAGRRGRSARVDFVFHPLGFVETVKLKIPELSGLVTACRDMDYLIDPPGYKEHLSQLEKLFDEYLVHGGYLTAIADIMRDGTIADATFRTYAEWLRGDILKHNKQEKYLFEVLRGMMRTYASQISWVSLAKQLSIEHHKTVSDYVAILEDMNAVIIQEAFAEHTFSAAPKKAKKLYFEDPFIFHAVEKMLGQMSEKSTPALAESVAVAHFYRKYGKTYYIKGNKGEVDIVYLKDNMFFPVEIKWSAQIRPEDLKQVMIYQNGLILGRRRMSSKIGHVPYISLIRYLLGN
ncbi:MAG: ATP-binding protein [Kiritimatiellae bacterium]|jgi:predicted AAA+ superfamily ATPase|nr:ATP-binding protein [Kiritimatiellia bacterium]